MATYESKKYAHVGTNLTALVADNFTTGNLAQARVDSGNVTQHVDLTALNASNLTSGTIPNGRYGTPTFNGSNLTNVPPPKYQNNYWGVYQYQLASNGDSANHNTNQNIQKDGQKGGNYSYAGHETGGFDSAPGTWKCYGRCTYSGGRCSMFRRTS